VVVPPVPVANEAPQATIILRRRRMTPALIMRIWRDAPFYRYPLPLRFSPFAADEVASLARAAQAGVGRIIVPAISAERFSRVLALAAQHEALYAALGLHPIVIESIPMRGWRSWKPCWRSARQNWWRWGDWPRSLSRRSAV
jgi:hypothetical protein